MTGIKEVSTIVRSVSVKGLSLPSFLVYKRNRDDFRVTSSMFVEKVNVEIMLFLSPEIVERFDPSSTLWFLTEPLQVEPFIYSNNPGSMSHEDPPSSCRSL